MSCKAQNNFLLNFQIFEKMEDNLHGNQPQYMTSLNDLKSAKLTYLQPEG